MASNEIDLKSYLHVVKKHKALFLASALIIMMAMTVRNHFLPDIYEARSTIFIEKSVISDLLKGLAVTPSSEDKVKVLSYALNSRTLVSKVLQELGALKTTQEAREKQLRSMEENTQVRIMEREGLFSISFRNRDPQFARNYVNTLVKRYIEENSLSKREDSYDATEFVSEQMGEVKARLDKAESAVTAFKTGPGAAAAVDPGVLQKEIDDGIQRLDDVRMRQAQLRATIAGLGRVSQAQTNLSALERKLQELQLHYTDRYPEIQQVKDEIRELKAQLSSNRGMYHKDDSPEYRRLASELAALRQSEATINANIARGRSLMRNIPNGKATLDELERERNSLKTLYESLLAKKGQSEVSRQVEVHDKSTVFRVVDAAVAPVLPIAPDRVKLLVLSIAAGIFGAAGIVFLRDWFDGSVKNLESARQFGVPVLAIIPRIEEPGAVTLQARRDYLLYLGACACFSAIVILAAVEARII